MYDGNGPGPVQYISGGSLLHGSVAARNPVPALTGKEAVIFRGRQLNLIPDEYGQAVQRYGPGARFGLSLDDFSKHVLMLGSTGAGKTTALFEVVEQILNRSFGPNDVMLIFDSKGDFYTKFAPCVNNSYVIGNSKQYRGISVHWNIFEEILADGMDEDDITANIQEICLDLFEERIRTSNNPFFPSAAADLLSAILLFLVRAGLEAPEFARANWNNAYLKSFLESKTREDLIHCLEMDDDQAAVCAYLQGTEESLGIVTELYSVTRRIFSGVFCKKGNFSIRRFTASRGAKVLFIENDLSLGATLSSIYRLLVDQALKEGLGQGRAKGNIFFIADEMRLLPHLKFIGDALNLGRSLGIKVVAGLQSIEQLIEIYKESGGRNIAAGFSTIFAFKSTDPSTLRYLKEAYGRYELRECDPRYAGSMDEHRQVGNTIEDWNLTGLLPGEAIICPAFRKPFPFKMDP